MKSARSRWITILLSLLAIGLWAGYKLYTGRQLEDSLITFRYVQNILFGNGFVFNPGERVLGTTTPLFTLLLTAFTAPLGASSVIAIADVLSIAASLASAWLIYFSFAEKNRLLGLSAALIYAINPVTIWSTTGGMETALVVFLMLLTWHLGLKGRLALSGLSAGLLALARPDALAWIGLVFLGLLVRAYRAREWSGLAKWSVIAVVVALPWVVFAWLYFGTVLPNTMAAKLAIDAQSRVLSFASLGEVLQLAGIGNGTWQPVSLLQILLFVTGAVTTIKWKNIWWIFPIYSIVFSALLYFGNAPFADWYWVPCKITALLTIVTGGYSIAYWIGERGQEARLASSIFILFVLATIGYSTWQFLSTLERNREYQIVENLTRKATGEWIRQHTDRHARILAEPIGYIGYYSRRYMIDLAGLVSPRVVRLAKEHQATNADLFRLILLSEVPDVIVLRSFEVRDNRHFHGGLLFEDSLRRASFENQFTLAAQFTPPAEYGESRAFNVYIRRQPRLTHFLMR